MSTAIDVGCPSCGAAPAANYCATCGQRAPHPADFTWRRFAAEAWEEVSGSDSRLWRTALGIFRPGVLTQAFAQYRWREFLPPLRLYLLVSAAFFLLAWNAYIEPQVAQLLGAPAGAIPENLRAVYADPATPERLSHGIAGFRFAGVLAMGGLVALLHRRGRVPVGRHLAFATHYYCADYAIFLLASPLVYFAPESLPGMSQAVTYAGIAWLGWWAVLADRRVYGGRWPANVARGLAIVVADLAISFVAGVLAFVAVTVVPK
jgi:hypothetical protein